MDETGKPMKRYPSDDVIEALAQARGQELPEGQLEGYADVLRGLVRLAKTELLIEMQHPRTKCDDGVDPG